MKIQARKILFFIKFRLDFKFFLLTFKNPSMEVWKEHYKGDERKTTLPPREGAAAPAKTGRPASQPPLHSHHRADKVARLVLVLLCVESLVRRKRGFGSDWSDITGGSDLGGNFLVLFYYFFLLLIHFLHPSF